MKIKIVEAVWVIIFFAGLFYSIKIGVDLTLPTGIGGMFAGLLYWFGLSIILFILCKIYRLLYILFLYRFKCLPDMKDID